MNGTEHRPTPSAGDGITAVAMSGGVDSSVAATLLAREGRDVVGFSMRLVSGLAGATDESARYGRCCSPEDFLDARRVADRWGFPHYVLAMEEEFERHVLRPFAEDYVRGRTPSPCVRCNTFVKFGVLFGKAAAVGAERVATGHYARLDREPGTGRTLLRRAADPDKDQSYYLFDLSQAQLARAEFPLGAMTKDAVRDAARDAGLANADKPESMDLCFVANGDDYREFLAREGLAEGGKPGAIVDRDGAVVGRHDGVERFTVGQRRGLGVSGAAPRYVTRIEPAESLVVIGSREDLERDRCTIERCRWIAFDRPPEDGVRATVRIRAGHSGATADVRPLGDGRAEVRFDEPQSAITPGQAAVAYDGDLVLGGGWIASS